MDTNDRWIDVELGDGRYRIIARAGRGHMGQVYRAFDRNLGTEVVIKFPIPADLSQAGPQFFERFEREIRSLVQLSHPHIVKIIDVGVHDDQHYVVMQYLAGGSLRDRQTQAADVDGQTGPLSPESLHGWLLEIAKALDFIHSQNFLHRDVKPANILFDRHGHAFLGDFGIIKAISAPAEHSEASSDLTAPGFLLGTPNYVAPEVVTGHPGDARVDQYSLAMTVHEVLTGRNVMTGPTPLATVMNQTSREAPPLATVLTGVPQRLSDAVRRALSKNPSERFDNCLSFAREALSDIPLPGTNTTLADSGWTPSRPIPVPSGIILPLEDDFSAPSLDPNAATAAVSIATTPPEAPGTNTTPKPTRPLHRSGAMLLAGSLLLGLAGILWGISQRSGSTNDDSAKPRGSAAESAAKPAPAAEPVVINLCYGTEKKRWLEDALKEFEKTHDPAQFKINLVGMGSVEGAQAILDGEKPLPIHVWSPASSGYLGVFEEEWRIKHKTRPVLRAENLALTPMVFVMWKSRRDEWIKKYKSLSFKSIADAVEATGGWSTIANKPDWGLFKFGHTHPNKSNSGLLTLTLMAYEFANKQKGLSEADVTSAAFQTWLKQLEAGVTRHSGSLTHSTGTMMQDMVLRGPSQYDCVVVYENLAIDYLLAARDRWGELYVDYPSPNLWNEHPYYILDVPWSSPEQRLLAGAFLDHLLSEPSQQRALALGFRPVSPAVSIRSAESPFVKHLELGLKLDVPVMAEPPSGPVVRSLMSSFARFDK